MAKAIPITLIVCRRNIVEDNYNVNKIKQRDAKEERF